MKNLTLASLFLISTAVLATSSDLYTLFESWKLKYSKEYSDPDLDAFRFAIFTENYNLIQKWNSEGNTAVLALNQFADLTNEEFGVLYTNSVPTQDEEISSFAIFDNVGTLPTNWSWISEGAVTSVKNQGACASDWANAAIAATEGLYKINGGVLTNFSAQQIVDCAISDKYGCNGAPVKTAFNYIANNTIETFADYPSTGEAGKCQYDPSKGIKTGVTGSKFILPKSASELYAAVYQQPTVVMVDGAAAVWQLYSKGIITTNCSALIDHSVTAVGYTADFFNIKNSWGPDWGLNGYVWVSSSSSYNAGLGACGIFVQPSIPTGLESSL